MTEDDARKAASKKLRTLTSLTMIEDRAQKVLDFLRSIELLIVDEAHRSSGNSFFRIIMHCTSAYWRCSLTATPLMKGNQEDDMKLIASSSEVICRIPNSLLIKRGILAQPYFLFREVPGFGWVEGRVKRELAAEAAKKGKKVSAGALYQVAYERGIVFNETRNAMVVEDTRRLVEEGRKTVVLVQREDHGKLLERMLNDAGISCRWIYGADDEEQRERAKRDLREGRIQAIVASTILDEGIDEPCISGIVLAGGGKSKISLFQRVGRSVRKKLGNELERLGNTARIIDYIDAGQRNLHVHSAQRFRTVKEEEGWIIERIETIADRLKKVA